MGGSQVPLKNHRFGFQFGASLKLIFLGRKVTIDGGLLANRKIEANVTRHLTYVTFQLVEVAVTRNLFAAILDRIERLALPPPVVDGSAV